VSINPIAVNVKLADLADNMDPERMALLPEEKRNKLMARYVAAVEVLKQTRLFRSNLEIGDSLDRFFCLDCQQLVFLNPALRCENCNGDHVTAHDYLTNIRDLDTMPVKFKTANPDAWITKNWSTRMFLRNADWERIEGNFSEMEKVMLGEAITSRVFSEISGSVLGLVIDEDKAGTVGVKIRQLLLNGKR
jgi:hypothetical protein